MLLEGMKIVILIGPEFEDLEFWVPLMRMQEEGAEVTVAGVGPNETFIGKHGVPGRSDVAFEAINPALFDAVLIPGGWAVIPAYCTLSKKCTILGKSSA
jgi:protease I